MIDPRLVLGTFAFAFFGGIVPVLNVEVYLVGLGAARPDAGLVPLALAATTGQVLAKIVLYGAGRGALSLPGLRRGGLERAVARLHASGTGAQALVFASALFGVPPYYATSVAAGALRVAFPTFVILGLVGRFARFAAILLAPRLLLLEG